MGVVCLSGLRRVGVRVVRYVGILLTMGRLVEEVGQVEGEREKLNGVLGLVVLGVDVIWNHIEGDVHSAIKFL